MRIDFKPLNSSHFKLIHYWFNKPHVQAFYSLRSWSLKEVTEKLTPYLKNEKCVQSFVIYNKEHPIGYIQSYPIEKHPWQEQDLSDDIIKSAAGIDLFIGEEEYLGKGFGSEIINCFLDKLIWPNYHYCLVDPNIQNKSSIRLFQKCGFIEHKQVEVKDALQRNVTLQLFIKKRPLITTLSDF